ncbi:hypothetical protein KXS07_36950, partial [Inquilinus limosus]|uniref:calcium-binding protein n=1 Tax=Inquilinus limosus TaxID=171674 RepID=UPI003F1471CC
ASYADSDTGVHVWLDAGFGRGGTAEGDSYEDIEHVEGSIHGDELIGDDGENRLRGGDGADTLEGGGGGDVLEGGDGDDVLVGKDGSDTMDGGTGDDTVSYAASAMGVVVELGGVGRGGEAEGDSYRDVETVIGSAYGDVLIGDGGANRLLGGVGDDVLVGGAGGDAMDGGAGVDTVDYSAGESVTVDLAAGRGGGDAEGDTLVGIENVIGSAHDDVIIASAAVNRIEGGAGEDTVSYGGSVLGVVVDLAAGTGTGDAEGDHYISIEIIEGSAFDDVLVGDDGGNRFGGGDGADTLEGGGGDDILEGGAGDDVLLGGAGGDRMDGGAGEDTVSYADSGQGVMVDLGGALGRSGTAEDDSYRDIENVIGSTRNDLLVGDGDANQLEGENGDDTLRGGAGADVLLGGLGNDVLEGGDGGDVLAGGSGWNTLLGGAGDDIVHGGAGLDGIDGGGGMDTVSYAGSITGVKVNLQTGLGSGGDAEGDSYQNIEDVEGSAHGDRLIGNDTANHLSGGDGNDTLEGRGGPDVLAGGEGVDTASYAGSVSGVQVDLGLGVAVGGDAEGDRLSGIEEVVGSAWNDMLVGDAGDNRLIGGGGDDVLVGGAGRDLLDGGSGADRFVLTAAGDSLPGEEVRDFIYDFNQAEGDKIDLSQIDADGDAGNGETAFTFIGSDRFSGEEGEIGWYHQSFWWEDDYTIVQGDIDGDKEPDFEIYLADRVYLTAGDFIL